VPVVDDVDVLREVESGPAPPLVARRERLVALRRGALGRVRRERLAEPRGCWRIVALDQAPTDDGSLRVEGRRIDAPQLVPASGRLTGLAFGVATLGARLEAEVGALFAARQASLAVALDGVANELLAALARRVQDRLLVDARRQGLTVAGELRAGDPGLELAAQPDVLALAGASAIGVGLAPTLMMQPAKTTSFVHGVGESLPAQTWSRCDRCRFRARCMLARTP
jgi:hypothetical protein